MRFSIELVSLRCSNTVGAPENSKADQLTVNMATYSRDVKADIPFILKNSSFAVEKPYTADVFTKEIPQTNIKTEKVYDIDVADMRPLKDSLDLGKHGFQILNFEGSMTYDDWSDQAKVETEYCRELGMLMKSHLGAFKVQVFEAQVSL